MTTMTNKIVLGNGTRTHRLSLKERFAKYMKENSAQITCGLLALNGDPNVYRIYAMLTEGR